MLAISSRSFIQLSMLEDSHAIVAKYNLCFCLNFCLLGFTIQFARIFCISSPKLLTNRHSGSYFSTTVRRKSLAVFALLEHFSFSLSTHFLPCTCFPYFFLSCLQKHLSFMSTKTFAFCVKKNILQFAAE